MFIVSPTKKLKASHYNYYSDLPDDDCKKNACCVLVAARCDENVQVIVSIHDFRDK